MRLGNVRVIENARTGGIMIGSVFRILLAPLLASFLLAKFLEVLGLSGMSTLWWLAAAPALYFAWVILLLTIYCTETTLLRPFIKKPRHFSFSDNTPPPFGISMAMLMYARMGLLRCLPGVPLLQRLDAFRPLVMRSYSVRTHIGPRATILGEILDPDLTFIKRGALIGDDTRILAHSFSRSLDGTVIAKFAPITIGRYATIGGGTQIELGSVIGAGSMVEPFSHVTAFTRIPPREVWGGSPAVFIRKRDPATPQAEPTGTTTFVDGSQVISTIEHALGLSPGSLDIDSDSSNCEQWDSLGQVSISAAIHTRFGLEIPSSQRFMLHSTRDVLQALAAHKPSEKVRTAERVPADLLPLLQSDTATSALHSLAEQTPANSEITINIASTFVATPLEQPLKAWCRAFGINADVVFTDFNRIIEPLLSGDSVFRKNRSGLNCVLVRTEDLLTGNDPDGSRLASEILDAVESFSKETSIPLLVTDLPPVLSPHASPHRGTGLNESWRNRLSKCPGTSILDFSSVIGKIGTVGAYDGKMDREASMPYRSAVYRELAKAICRSARSLRLAPKKVLALDADGTLWAGSVAEDGTDGISVLGAYSHIQEIASGLRDRGVILVLVSRNEPADIATAFAAHPGMPLEPDHFAAKRINWESKSGNLRSIAAELNLSLDSFVFADDSPAERADVEFHCPEVTVLPFTDDPDANASMLSSLWCFDSTIRTKEDAERSDYLHHESERQKSASSSLDFQSYLRSLEVVVEMRPALPADFPRVSQLTQKSNQFNLSLRRRDLHEIEDLFKTHSIHVVSARDRFGDYGLVGVAILSPAESATGGIEVDTFLLSCRALGRGAEEALLHGVCGTAREQGCASLRFPFIKGARNAPLLTFLEKQPHVRRQGDTFFLDPLSSTSPPTHLSFIRKS